MATCQHAVKITRLFVWYAVRLGVGRPFYTPIKQKISESWVNQLLQGRSCSELLCELSLHSAAHDLVSSGELGDLLVLWQF